MRVDHHLRFPTIRIRALPLIKIRAFSNSGIESSMGLPLENEETVRKMVEREKEHLPRNDYLRRLRNGDLDWSIRREALAWIWKASSQNSFGPLSVCLSLNYLDRFLSVHEIQRDKSWVVQLLAVACLSLAAKMEETEVPHCSEIQVGDTEFVFESKTIRRMELLILNALGWRMRAITPCSYIDYFLEKMIDGQPPSLFSISKSLQLILNTSKGIDFLEFRPSEIAAAVASYVSGEVYAVNIDDALASLVHIEKGRVKKCVELMKDLSLGSGYWPAPSSSSSSSSSSSVAESPVRVLEGPCLSYKSDEITVGLSADSSHHTSDNNRMEPNKPSLQDFCPKS